MEANVKRYGVTSDGEAFLVTLQAGDIEANITNYGCIIQSIKAPDRNGEKIDVVLGFDKLEDGMQTEYRTRDSSSTESSIGYPLTMDGTVFMVAHEVSTRCFGKLTAWILAKLVLVT
jgi:hypothetical protein